MKKIWKIATALFVVGIIAAVFVALYVFRKPIESVANQKADFTIQADSLLMAFETDENAANAKYLDKIITVKGTIAEITSDTSGYTIVLRNETALSGVSCLLGKDQTEKAATIALGQELTLKGICNGYLMDVVLNKGAIVEDAE